MRVASAQLAIDPSRSFDANVAAIVAFIAEARAKGVELIVFPEAALTTYVVPLVERSVHSVEGREQLSKAERTVCDACREHGVAAVIGMPFVDTISGECYNSACVIDETGRVVGRHHKMQLVRPDESWSVAGTAVQVFVVRGVSIGVVICHDTRYPELTRLPVLKGARIICYISCEQWHDDLPLVSGLRTPAWSAERLAAERRVYLAQSQARAVENRVWLIKSNVPVVPPTCADKTLGSHGQCCVIDPTGMVVALASSDAAEELVCATIDVGAASALYATKSVRPGYALNRWWRAALDDVTVVR